MIVKPCSQRAPTTSWKLHVSQYFNTSTKSITSELPRRQVLGLSAKELCFPTFDDAVLFPPSHQAVIFQARLMTHHSAAYCKPAMILNHCGSLDVPASKTPCKDGSWTSEKRSGSPAKFVKMDTLTLTLITLTFWGLLLIFGGNSSGPRAAPVFKDKMIFQLLCSCLWIMCGRKEGRPVKLSYLTNLNWFYYSTNWERHSAVKLSRETRDFSVPRCPRGHIQLPHLHTGTC